LTDEDEKEEKDIENEQRKYKSEERTKHWNIVLGLTQ
jgi:hypothetical protein